MDPRRKPLRNGGFTSESALLSTLVNDQLIGRCIALIVARFPFPLLSTGCPEVIELVNHSATVLAAVQQKSLF